MIKEDFTMKKIIAFATGFLLLFTVGCGANSGESSSSITSAVSDSVSAGELEESTEIVETGEKITFDDVSLIVPIENWVKYSEELEEGTVSYQHIENPDAEIGVLFMPLQGIDIEGLTAERALEILESKVQEEENIEIISLERKTVQGHSVLLACYNETLEGDSLEDTVEEKNQGNIYIAATDTGIMMIALVAPDSTELYLDDFTNIVESVSFQ